MGILYLVQPSELRNTYRFKIGRSSKSDLSRVRSYRNGTRYLCVMECTDDIYVERLLINHFNKNYKKIAGHEYFEGDELCMLNSFIKIVMKYKNKSIENEKKTEEIPEVVELSEPIKCNKVLNTWMDKFKFKVCDNITK
jgi:hypothetical protein